MQRWGEIWRAGELPLAEVESYLRKVHHRFDLLDTVTPSYQVADFETAAGVFRLVELLITIFRQVRSISPREPVPALSG